MLAYIVYKTEKERQTLLDWCIKYNIHWDSGNLIDRNYNTIYSPSPGYPMTISIRKGSDYGNIRRCDDLSYMRKHFSYATEFHMFNNDAISTYLRKDNIITEEIFKELILKSKEV